MLGLSILIQYKAQHHPTYLRSTQSAINPEPQTATKIKCSRSWLGPTSSNQRLTGDLPAGCVARRMDKNCSQKKKRMTINKLPSSLHEDEQFLDFLYLSQIPMRKADLHLISETPAHRHTAIS